MPATQWSDALALGFPAMQETQEKFATPLAVGPRRLRTQPWRLLEVAL